MDETPHPRSATSIEARCPDCTASLRIPVLLSGLRRGESGDRQLVLTVQDPVFEPYIRQHLQLSAHPRLAEELGEDWRYDDREQVTEQADKR
ncbi:hypothetical protein [Actinosynnema mirum]|uniref:Uncharacterized protein n=1 Tax=Actinosynnema mirum (strain ATCC 29888 / DSM 43827 / JCM 3225 / NBRC 14064 / NCIMB 13271 / NRRL B-12336 / IMRU 3971 / 101) TaxID=446462 RepID=C6WC41_ACTMD|nr:hypothetical protein [Actinosynnema mirum]ACU39429.1 hypothetical protein Amir_5613 [Actinosynnema mirum DSM 43827]